MQASCVRRRPGRPGVPVGPRAGATVEGADLAGPGRARARRAPFAGALATVATVPPLATVAMLPALAAVKTGPAPCRQLSCNGFADRPFKQLDAVGVVGFGRPGRFNRYNGDAVEPEVGLGPHDVAVFCSAVQK